MQLAFDVKARNFGRLGRRGIAVMGRQLCTISISQYAHLSRFRECLRSGVFPAGGSFPPFWDKSSPVEEEELGCTTSRSKPGRYRPRHIQFKIMFRHITLPGNI